jgi:hypothetical protein
MNTSNNARILGLRRFMVTSKGKWISGWERGGNYSDNSTAELRAQQKKRGGPKPSPLVH